MHGNCNRCLREYGAPSLKSIPCWLIYNNLLAVRFTVPKLPVVKLAPGWRKRVEQGGAENIYAQAILMSKRGVKHKEASLLTASNWTITHSCQSLGWFMLWTDGGVGCVRSFVTLSPRMSISIIVLFGRCLTHHLQISRALRHKLIDELLTQARRVHQQWFWHSVRAVRRGKRNAAHVNLADIKM